MRSLTLLVVLLLSPVVRAEPKPVGHCLFSAMGLCDEFTTGDAAARKKDCTSGLPSGKFKPGACPTKAEVARCAYTSGDLAGNTRVFYSPTQTEEKAGMACNRSVATFTSASKKDAAAPAKDAPAKEAPPAKETPAAAGKAAGCCDDSKTKGACREYAKFGVRTEKDEQGVCEKLGGAWKSKEACPQENRLGACVRENETQVWYNAGGNKGGKPATVKDACDAMTGKFVAP